MKFVTAISLRMVALMSALIGVTISVCAYAQAAANPDSDFFSGVLAFIRDQGGMPWMAKVGAVVLLILASMKVSFLKPLWDKLGAGKVLGAPILGLIGGLVSMGSAFTWQGALAYITAGAGAVFFHEILDFVKAIPGLGSIYVAIIGIIENIPVVGSGGK